MDLSPAPFLEDVAGGPDGGAAWWATTSDRVRIRVGAWPLEGARGTVLLFPGRTEYIEKYGDSARHLAERGFAMVAVDWRGQGLADRLLPDRRLGHVVHFQDYQKDVAAALDLALTLDLPKPFFLIGHSMGGCIGLRALVEGLPVARCAFSGPMWGINFGRSRQTMAMAVAFGAPLFGMGLRLPPGGLAEPYVMTQPFEGNMLTPDVGMYDMMRGQLRAHPDLALGGPTLHWLRAAIIEMNVLHRLPSPGMPCLTFCGSNERIVDVIRIRHRMSRWPGGTLDLVDGGEHEVLMDRPQVRARIFDRLAEHFGAST